MQPFLTEDSVDKKDSQYFLYAVLVHSGKSSRGHYFAYFKLNSKWIQINDTYVKEVNETQAIQNNFGVVNSDLASNPTAYLLMYIKKSSQNLIFNGMENFEYPLHLQKFVSKNPMPIKIQDSKEKIIVIYDKSSYQKAAEIGRFSLCSDYGIQISVHPNSLLRDIIPKIPKKESFKIWSCNNSGQIYCQIQEQNRKPFHQLSTNAFFLGPDKEFSNQNIFLFYYYFNPNFKNPLAFYDCFFVSRLLSFQDALSSFEKDIINSDFYFISNKVIHIDISTTIQSFVGNKNVCMIVCSSKNHKNYNKKPLLPFNSTFFHYFPKFIPQNFPDFFESIKEQIIIQATVNHESNEISFPPTIQFSDLILFIIKIFKMKYNSKQHSLSVYEKYSHKQLQFKETDFVTKFNQEESNCFIFQLTE
jgi:hypothetical protein